MYLPKYIKRIQESDGSDAALQQILLDLIAERDDQHHWAGWDHS